MNAELIDALKDRIAQLEAALRKVETFMMIVEPRSHKAEYINMLASVRCVLPPYAPQTETACDGESNSTEGKSK